jgi:hypothetical protein
MESTEYSPWSPLYFGEFLWTLLGGVGHCFAWQGYSSPSVIVSALTVGDKSIATRFHFVWLVSLLLPNLSLQFKKQSET